jgi:hypothetical protein
MHMQIRSAPATSPADLRKFLAVLERAGINIEAAGGSDVEKGGEFAFAVRHGTEQDAIRALEDAGYHPHLEEVDFCWMTNNPGQLLTCVARVAERNAQSSRVIKDVAIGVPDKQGRIPVQIYSEAG